MLMIDCGNCGKNVNDTEYHCTSCGYPIKGTYEERSKFSMGGGEWKSKFDGRADEFEEKRLNKKILVGSYTILIMGIIHIIFGTLLLINEFSVFVHDGSNQTIGALLLALGLGQSLIFFTLNNKLEDKFLVAIIIRGVVLLVTYLYCSTVDKEMGIEWILLWILLEAVIITFLSQSLMASKVINDYKRE